MAELFELLGENETSLLAELTALKATKTRILTGGQGFQKKEFQVNQVEFKQLNIAIKEVEAKLAFLKANEL